MPFALAGVVGFLVDAGLLLVVGSLLGPFGGRLVSFAAAVATTWLINRNFAFADRAAVDGKVGEFLRYFLAMLPGAVVNWLVYSLIVSIGADNPTVLILAVAMGSLAGMAANLTAANGLVFRKQG